MNKPKLQELIVTNKRVLTPNMLRITLGGENIKTLPEGQEGGYVKLIFPNDGAKPLLRTYTIRHQRPVEIDIDFMVHAEGGPACLWAQQAKVGDTIVVGGPGPKKLIEEKSDWKLFVGDMTSLPAISVNLAELNDSTQGYAVIEVVSEDDIQELKCPPNLEISWVVNPQPGVDSHSLLNEIKSLPWLAGQVSVWAACEFNSMRALRDFIKKEKNVPKSNIYVSSYWKLGINEDQHKVEKRMDAEQETA